MDLATELRTAPNIKFWDSVTIRLCDLVLKKHGTVYDIFDIQGSPRRRGGCLFVFPAYVLVAQWVPWWGAIRFIDGEYIQTVGRVKETTYTSRPTVENRVIGKALYKSLQISPDRVYSLVMLPSTTRIHNPPINSNLAVVNVDKLQDVRWLQTPDRLQYFSAQKLLEVKEFLSTFFCEIDPYALKCMVSTEVQKQSDAVMSEGVRVLVARYTQESRDNSLTSVAATSDDRKTSSPKSGENQCGETVRSEGITNGVSSERSACGSVSSKCTMRVPSVAKSTARKKTKNIYAALPDIITPLRDALRCPRCKSVLRSIPELGKYTCVNQRACQYEWFVNNSRGLPPPIGWQPK